VLRLLIHSTINSFVITVLDGIDAYVLIVIGTIDADLELTVTESPQSNTEPPLVTWGAHPKNTLWV